MWGETGGSCHPGLLQIGILSSIWVPPPVFVFSFYQDYKSENSALLSSARNSPEDSVSRSILLNRLDSETAFASFSAFLVSVINHRDWFLPETDLAGGVTVFEGNKCSWALTEFLLGDMWGQSLSPCFAVHDTKAEHLPRGRARPTWGTGLGEQ